MPNISGIDLAKLCFEEYPDVGVLLMSAYRDFEYAHSAIKYNVTDYVLKPINETDFINAVHKLHAHLTAQQQIMSRPSEFSQNMIIQEAVSYIRGHYNENITAKSVAKHVMISPEYFGAYFKKHYGENFIPFLQRVRMEKACELLRNKNLTISAVAEMVGYKSTTHFYEIFQSFYGQSPAHFRNSLKTKGS